MSDLSSQNAAVQDKVNEIVDKDVAKGRVAVHAFDPEATPQEKAAIAGRGRDKLKSVTDKPGTGERDVPVDTGDSNVVPTISIHDVDGNPEPPKKLDAQPKVAEPDEVSVPPGDMPSSPARPIPDWYKVGWRAAAGLGKPPLEEGEEKDRGILEMFLAEQFYGDWYHNAALIFFVVFASHFLTRFHFGWGWLFILLAVANTYYSTSMERVRRRSRDDIQRELVKTRLASEHESADWINNFLDRFWLIYEPVLSQTVISSVDQILSVNTPPFLDSLRLSTFTLGTKAPRIDKVRTFPKTAEDVVLMDWGISFTPNDVSDITPRQAATKVNPKVVLSVRLGKGFASAAMPILLEDITFTCLMRIRLKLMSNFPHVQLVDLSLLEPPVIDYVLKPVGGEFGFDINNIPGLSAFIRGLTHSTLGPMMYDPNVFTLNLEQLLSGTPLDAAIGVLKVTVQSARGIKGSKIGGGSPDPFVAISINERAELSRTKYKHNTYNPTWMETKFILVNNLNETLVMTLYDWNDHRKNTLLGAASFEMAKLVEDATQEDLETAILKDGKERGELKFDISYYPVLKPEAGKEEDIMENTSVGIVRLTVHQAKDLDVSKSLSGDLNPFAKVYIGGQNNPIHTTTRFKHTNNPVWESATEFLCSNRASSVITAKIIDDRDFLKDPVVGYMSIKLEDLLEAKKEAGRDWWPLSGCKSGRLRLSVEWKPLNMAGALHGADQYVPPIGVVRLHLQKATNVKNVEAALGGKSDPYVRVQINNVTKGRTEVVNNNLNPEWNQILYVPVHSLRETLLLECMDYQYLTKDRSLGTVELRVSDLANDSPDRDHPYVTTGKRVACDPIRLEKSDTQKGELHYVAEFVPALLVPFEKFEEGENEVQRAAAGGGDEDDGSTAYDGSSLSDEDHHSVPVGITVSKPIGATKGHKKAQKSTDTASVHSRKSSFSSVAGSENGAVAVEKPEELAVLRKSKEELLQYQSGIIVFNVVSGQLYRKGRLEVLLDDGYWPAFTTLKSRSTHAMWESIGEGFVKELDFGRVWFRLNENDDGDEKEDIIGEWSGNTKAFLEETLDGPKSFDLVGDKVSVIEIEARYIPVPVQLEARESVNNQGLLKVELIDGQDIHGIDRSGKSDPYAVFSLNDQKIFKSQTKKKTLSPVWNENFEVQVPSRTNDDFTVELFDWNQIEQAKSLGSAHIDLSTLEPFQSAERTINLVSPKHGEKGSVRIRLLFRPEILVKSRQNTHATFHSATKTVTHLGSLPAQAGKGVFHGVTGVFKKEKDFANTSSDDSPPPELPTGQASQPVGQSDTLGGGTGSAFPSSNSGEGGKALPGTLKVTVLDAKDLTYHDAKPYVTLRVGDKEFKTKHSGKSEWNESFIIPAGPLTPKLFLWVHDHKTLGKDKLLGEGDIDIWRHIQGDKTSSADVFAELRDGQGIIRLRLEFDVDLNPNNNLSGEPSRTSIDRVGTSSMFSLRGKKSMEVGKT